MVTNHICTVIRPGDDGNYIVVGRYPCMWQESKGYEAADYGQKCVSVAKIYIPDITADVLECDYVTSKNVSGFIVDVSGMLSAVIVTCHDYGSKSMQHIRVVAK